MNPCVTEFDTIVFPGQGAQRPGMGLDFVEAFPAARAVYAEVADAIEVDVIGACRDEALLARTEYAQPCLLACEIAQFRVLEAEVGLAPARFGGHSLGEYSALVAAGALPLASAARILRARGRLMQGAASDGGGMLAVTAAGLDHSRVLAIATAAGIDVASENAPSQLVLSGNHAGLQRARGLLQPLVRAGARLVDLDVSAPFHSRCMHRVAAPLREQLVVESRSWAPASARRVTSNTLGGFHAGDLAALVYALVAQVALPVRWIENMRALATPGARFLEVGPGRPLSGFLRELGHAAESVVGARHVDRLRRRA